MKEMIETPAHAIYAPSSFGNRRLCRHFAPDSETNAYAIDGTHSHTLLDKCIKELMPAANEYLGRTLSDHEGDFVVEMDRVSRVNLVLKYLRERVEILQIQFPNSVIGVSSETKSNPGRHIGRDDWHGTADIVIQVHLDNVLLLLEIIDFKDGRRPVHPEGDQMKSYALGFLEPEGYDTTVILTIYQPKVSYDPAVAYFSGEKLIKQLPEFARIIRECEDPPYPPMPGEDQCTFCVKRLGCDARNEWQSKAMIKAFESVNVPTLDLPHFEEVRGKLTPTNIGKLLDIEDVVIQRFKEIRAEALSQMQDGVAIPGYKPVRAATKSRWVDDINEIRKRLRKRKLNDREFLKNSMQSIAAVMGNPKLGERQKKWIRANLITKPKGGIVIAKDNDPREAVVLDPTLQFQNAPSEEELTAKTPETKTPETKTPEAPPIIPSFL